MELSEEVWERASPLLPAQKPHPQGERPRRDDRQMLGVILYVLRAGIQLNTLPREIGASTTCYDRFREWARWLLRAALGSRIAGVRRAGRD